jgi:serine/threonine-protein kinase RsbW
MTELYRRGTASAGLATALRHELVGWMCARGVAAEKAQDIGLASYEAMTNIVMHAYPSGTVGVLELDAAISPHSIAVTVADRGRWHNGTPGDGYGLTLIHRLSEHAEVVRGEHGTMVLMTWYPEVPAAHG